MMTFQKATVSTVTESEAPQHNGSLSNPTETLIAPNTENPLPLSTNDLIPFYGEFNYLTERLRFYNYYTYYNHAGEPITHACPDYEDVSLTEPKNAPKPVIDDGMIDADEPLFFPIPYTTRYSSSTDVLPEPEIDLDDLVPTRFEAEAPSTYREVLLKPGR